MSIIILYNISAMNNFKNEYDLVCTVYFSKIGLCTSLVGRYILIIRMSETKC